MVGPLGINRGGCGGEEGRSGHGRINIGQTPIRVLIRVCANYHVGGINSSNVSRI